MTVQATASGSAPRGACGVVRAASVDWTAAGPRGIEGGRAGCVAGILHGPPIVYVGAGRAPRRHPLARPHVDLGHPDFEGFEVIQTVTRPSSSFNPSRPEGEARRAVTPRES